MNDTYMGTGLSYYQHTLADSFHCIGRGLHTGLKVAMTVQPNDENTGYIFHRRDVQGLDAEVPARWHTVGDTTLSTTVVNKMGVRVSTIEHLLAALHGCGIDNAYITLDGPEVPILDGSSRAYVELIRQVGTVRQDAKRRALLVTKEVSVADGKSKVSFNPSLVPSLKMEIEFSSSVIGKQSLTLALSDKVFEEQLYDARTFGFAEQIKALRTMGYVRGGSLRNAVVVSGSKVMNKEGLRYTNEFVRHKCLDAIGDLALAGGTIVGQYDGIRSGHKLNNRLLRALMTQRESYKNITLDEAFEYWQAQYSPRASCQA